jgi:DNA-binding NarL/FixJ family response regulator
MRVVLVGSSRERLRLRSQLEGTAMEIVGEFPTQAAARVAATGADAIVTASGSRESGDEPLAEPLTARETEVLALVAEGLSNKTIADQLGISDQTVKFHVASIAGKLGAANRTEAVRRAVRRGLIVL